MTLKKYKNTKIKLKLYKIICGNQSLRKKANKLQKSTNGNISNKIRIISWNKADLNITMKLNNIKQIIVKNKPQILIINELNLENNQFSGITNINGYNFISDSLNQIKKKI